MDILTSLPDMGISSKGRMKDAPVYLNYIVTFDIETTNDSIMQGKEIEYFSYMYHWQMCIEGYVILGRKWEELMELFDYLSSRFHLNEKRRLVIYVHNLAFEFQFLLFRFQWLEEYGANSPHRPYYAVTNTGLEFRCSYYLTGFSLEALGKQKEGSIYNKMVGDLDYEKIRHYDTPLTERERDYCIADVGLLYDVIKDYRIMHRGMADIPHTKTGYIRRDMKKRCLNGKEKKEYVSLMKQLCLEPKEFELWTEAFMGGFTHASPFASGNVIKDVSHKDICSEYPSIMCLFSEFSVSKGECIFINSIDELEKYINYYALVMRIAFYGVKAKFPYEFYISSHKCRNLKNASISNGRIVSADAFVFSCTHVDFKIIRQVYDIESLVILDAYAYAKGYLPKQFVEGVLHHYENKTKLKGVEGRKQEYDVSKQNVNSCYGMMVTSPMKPDVRFNREWKEIWKEEEKDLRETINKLNEDNKRFLFYPWGVIVTALGRHMIWNSILNLKEDYCYSDTDSVFYQNGEKHESLFSSLNDMILEMIEKASIYFDIPMEKFMPKTMDGRAKPLGIWENEPNIEEFKALRAKCYMGRINGEYWNTTAGCRKRKDTPEEREKTPSMIEWMESNGRNVMNEFANHMTVPAQYTGRLVSRYRNVPFTAIVTDYMGLSREVHEESCIHLSASDYHLEMDEYEEFLDGYVHSMENWQV